MSEVKTSVTQEDGTIYTVFEDGTELFETTDGTRQLVNPDGTQYTEYPNGDKDQSEPTGRLQRRCADGRSITREADGSIKCLYPDGRLLKHNKAGKSLTYPCGFSVEVDPNGHRVERCPIMGEIAYFHGQIIDHIRLDGEADTYRIKEVIVEHQF